MRWRKLKIVKRKYRFLSNDDHLPLLIELNWPATNLISFYLMSSLEMVTFSQEKLKNHNGKSNLNSSFCRLTSTLPSPQPFRQCMILCVDRHWIEELPCWQCLLLKPSLISLTTANSLLMIFKTFFSHCRFPGSKTHFLFSQLTDVSWHPEEIVTHWASDMYNRKILEIIGKSCISYSSNSLLCPHPYSHRNPGVQSRVTCGNGILQHYLIQSVVSWANCLN